MFWRKLGLGIVYFVAAFITLLTWRHDLFGVPLARAAVGGLWSVSLMLYLLYPTSGGVAPKEDWSKILLTAVIFMGYVMYVESIAPPS